MVHEDLISAVFVIGPTASGKTALAHALAERFPSLACVNLDAFQFYRGVSAGTAKPSRQEIARYEYALIDFLEAPDRIDARDYGERAAAVCGELFACGRVPLCVGGSGLYLRSLLHGLDDLPSADAALRAHLRAEALAQGWPALHARLAQVDPVRAAELHPNDATRIERALEIHALTGVPMSTLRERTVSLAKQPTRMDAFVVRVEPRADWLKERISRRTCVLVGPAWRDEVASLRAAHGAALREFQSMRAIGYPLILDALEGARTWDEEALAADIATLTWRYARRQLTWNRKELAQVIWDPAGGDFRKIESAVAGFLAQVADARALKAAGKAASTGATGGDGS